MRLEVEGKPPVENPSEALVRSTMMRLRSYGPSSFASLTDQNGNYLQVAGGGVTCMLERHDADTGRHYRAYHDDKSPVFPDGTALVFGGGEIRLSSDEWFVAEAIADAFSAFLKKNQFPESIKWRDVSEMFSS